MNRRYVGIALLLAMMAMAVWVAGCNRPMSSGPIPKPQSVTSGTVSPTPQGMPTTVAGTVIAGATATVMAAATTQPGAAEPSVPPTATPTPLPLPTPTPVPAASSGQTSYTVKPGDRLFSIGREFGVNPFAIAQANRIGPPYTIRPGQVLVIPSGGGVGPSPTPGAPPTTHTVVRGETIYSIARRYGRSAAAIINANNLINPNFIFPGQVLNIP